jgi:hypothetical protein
LNLNLNHLHFQYLKNNLQIYHSLQSFTFILLFYYFFSNFLHQLFDCQRNYFKYPKSAHLNSNIKHQIIAKDYTIMKIIINLINCCYLDDHLNIDQFHFEILLASHYLMNFIFKDYSE